MELDDAPVTPPHTPPAYDGIWVTIHSQKHHMQEKILVAPSAVSFGFVLNCQNQSIFIMNVPCVMTS